MVLGATRCNSVVLGANHKYNKQKWVTRWYSVQIRIISIKNKVTRWYSVQLGSLGKANSMYGGCGVSSDRLISKLKSAMGNNFNPKKKFSYWVFQHNQVDSLEFWRSVYSSFTLFFLASLGVHSPCCDPYILLTLSIFLNGSRKVSCRGTKIKILLPKGHQDEKQNWLIV